MFLSDMLPATARLSPQLQHETWPAYLRQWPATAPLLQMWCKFLYSEVLKTLWDEKFVPSPFVEQHWVFYRATCWVFWPALLHNIFQILPLTTSALFTNTALTKLFSTNLRVSFLYLLLLFLLTASYWLRTSSQEISIFYFFFTVG